MTSILLSIVDLFLTMGIPPIDEHLHLIINQVENFNLVGLNNIRRLAQVIGCALALCMSSYEGYMMILGRRPIDVMRVARIIGFSLCITQANLIASACGLPGNALANDCYAQMSVQNEMVADALKTCSSKQKQYRDSLHAKIDTLTNRQIQKMIADNMKEDPDWLDDIVTSIKTAFAEAQGEIKKMVISLETLVSEAINEGFRFIGEVIFEITFFGIVLASKFMMKVLVAFCPIAFALSIVPPWASAWSSWISKYVSLSLWPFLCYSCVTFVDFILLYEINTDITAYQTLLGENPLSQGTWEGIFMLGLQNIGATCRYVIALIIGAILLKFVPEISSWLIPGGASSSIGSTVGGMVSSATMFAGGIALKSSASTVSTGASVTNKVGGAVGGAVIGAGGGAANGAYSSIKNNIANNAYAANGSAAHLVATSMLVSAGLKGIANGAIGGVKGGVYGGTKGITGAARDVGSQAYKAFDKLSDKIK